MPSGVSINMFVRQTWELYDHNRDGVIDLTPRVPGGKFFKPDSRIDDERVRSDVYQGSSAPHPAVGPIVMSNVRLFEAADTDNDRILTQYELHRYISTHHDTNQNGYLDSRGLKFWGPPQELETFKATIGERQVHYGAVVAGDER